MRSPAAEGGGMMRRRFLCAHLVPRYKVRLAFGWFLIASGIAFTVYRPAAATG